MHVYKSHTEIGPQWHIKIIRVADVLPAQKNKCNSRGKKKWAIGDGRKTSRIRTGDGQTTIMRCQRWLSSGRSGEQSCLDPSDRLQVLSPTGREWGGQLRTMANGERTKDNGHRQDDFHANKRRRAQHFLSHNEQQQQQQRMNAEAWLLSRTAHA